MPYYLTKQEYVSVREVVVEADTPDDALNLRGDIVSEYEVDFYWADHHNDIVEDVTGDYE